MYISIGARSHSGTFFCLGNVLCVSSLRTLLEWKNEGFQQRLSSRRIVLLGTLRPSLQLGITTHGLEKLIFYAEGWESVLSCLPIMRLALTRGSMGNQGMDPFSVHLIHLD